MVGKHDDHDRKADVYDRFADYVREKMRGRDNPNISVREFDLMGRSGVTHMDLVLENVSKGTQKLYKLVEQFDERAFLDTKEDIQTGNLIYVAHIPFKSKEKKRHHHHHNGEEGPPSTNLLMLYVFLFMILIIIGVIKTSANEWRYMLGYN